LTRIVPGLDNPSLELYAVHSTNSLLASQQSPAQGHDKMEVVQQTIYPTHLDMYDLDPGTGNLYGNIDANTRSAIWVEEWDSLGLEEKWTEVRKMWNIGPVDTPLEKRWREICEQHRKQGLPTGIAPVYEVPRATELKTGEWTVTQGSNRPPPLEIVGPSFYNAIRSEQTFLQFIFHSLHASTYAAAMEIYGRSLGCDLRLHGIPSLAKS
jgi:hypothetical protein